MRKEVVLEGPEGRVVIMDSITKVTPEDEGSIVVAASHGGASSGEFALEVPLRLAVLNDAGIGKDDAGIASLPMLEQRGVAGATISHVSARIGDCLDMWENGVISRLNAPARAMGLVEGESLRRSLTSLVGGGRRA
jgi:hypothetical protein